MPPRRNWRSREIWRTLTVSVPSSTGLVVPGHLRIFDKEWLLIETVRMRTKMPFDLYHEVIGNFRQISEELYPAKMEDYLDAFPKREVIFDVIRKEVL